MATTAIATIHPAATSTLVVAEQYLESFGNKLSKAHKNQFLNICQSFGLNPFIREIYGVPFGDKFNIIVGYEVYLKRAENSGRLAGWRSWTEGEGRGMKGCVEIQRTDWKAPFYHEVYLTEYDQSNSMWKSKPMTMIKKVAIAQGFRLAFPVELGGLPYTSDEMPSEPEVRHEPTKTPVVVDQCITRVEGGTISNELKNAGISPVDLFGAYGITRLGELKTSQWDAVMEWIASNKTIDTPVQTADPVIDAVVEAPDNTVLLQEVYRLITQAAQVSGDTPDDYLDNLTKGKIGTLIDLQDQREATLLKLKIALEPTGE